MRNIAVCIGSFFFLTIVGFVGCSGVENPFRSTSTTTSRISGGGSATSEDMAEGTVIFNDRLDISSGGLVNPIPSLRDRTAGDTVADTDIGNSDGIWPDEVRNADDAPEPDEVVDSDGGGGIYPDEVVDSDDGDDFVDEVIDSDDGDGFVSEVIDSDGGDDFVDEVIDVPSSDADSNDDDDDDGDIWGDVVD